MIRLKYGNTNTFLIPCSGGYLLADTDLAGTLPGFYRSIKQAGVKVSEISYVLATHYHPDHIGLVPELMKSGVKLLLIDIQKDYVHFSDHIFARDGLPFEPIDEAKATLISCAESRRFLKSISIAGEIISAPSHSPDSVVLMLDNGDCIAGDLEPMDFLDAYPADCTLREDWEEILRRRPKRILYAHANERIIENEEK